MQSDADCVVFAVQRADLDVAFLHKLDNVGYFYFLRNCSCYLALENPKSDLARLSPHPVLDFFSNEYFGGNRVLALVIHCGHEPARNQG